MNVIPLQTPSIAQATQDALARLAALSEDSSAHAEGEELETATRRYSDEIERLEIWAHEQHAKSGGLDHRLRGASLMRTKVLSLLAQLSGRTYAKSQYSDSEQRRSGGVGLETLVAGQPVHLLDVEDDDATSLSLDTNFTLPDSLSDSPLTHIHDVVNLLLGLGPTLLDPTPRDRFERSTHKDVAHYDIDHVQASFSKATEALINRLGHANWERRQYLINLRSRLDEGLSQARKLNVSPPIESQVEQLTLESSASDSGTDSSDDAVSDVDHASIPISRACSTVQGGISISATQTILTSDGRSEFQFSANDIESTAPTEPSKGVPPFGQAISRYSIPPPPSPNAQLNGNEFLCPFCAHKILDMKSRSEWK